MRATTPEHFLNMRASLSALQLMKALDCHKLACTFAKKHTMHILTAATPSCLLFDKKQECVPNVQSGGVRCSVYAAAHSAAAAGAAA